MIELIVDAVLQALIQLRAHRDRALLTLFGITWGTAAMVALVSWGGGLRSTIRDDMTKLGDNIAMVWPRAAKVSKQDATKLRPVQVELDDTLAMQGKIAGARYVMPENNQWGMAIRHGNRSTPKLVIGVSPDTKIGRAWHVTEGRFIEDIDMRRSARVCLLGSAVEAKLFRGENPIGERITIGGIPFHVIGRLAAKNQIMMNMNGPDDEKVLIPATTAERYFGSMRYVEQICISMDTAYSGPETEGSVRHYLAKLYHFDPDDEDALMFFDTARLVRLADFSTNGIRIFVGLIGAGTLIIAGLGVMNIMLVSVRERTPEVGLRLALGGRRADIFVQFLTESLVVTVLGGLIGITIALVICVAVASLDLPDIVPVPEISKGAVVAAIVTMTAVGLTAGTWPAYQAARLDPVEALRYE